MDTVFNLTCSGGPLQPCPGDGLEALRVAQDWCTAAINLVFRCVQWVQWTHPIHESEAAALAQDVNRYQRTVNEESTN